MAKTDITKQAGTVVSPQRDIFAAMRDEMDKMFERFEHGFPRWPALFHRARGNGNVIPELDVRENATSMTVEAELPGVDEKDISVTLANGVLTLIVSMPLASMTETSFSSTPGSSASTTIASAFSWTSRSGIVNGPSRRNREGHRSLPFSNRSNMRSISSRMALKMSRGRATAFSGVMVISVLAIPGALSSDGNFAIGATSGRSLARPGWPPTH